MKLIPLTRGLSAQVDDADYEWLSSFTWHADEKGYARRRIRVAVGRQVGVLMHRFILGLEFGNPLFCDHIDGNRANNQRANLRICTEQQNCYNRKRYSTNTTGFKGVTFKKRSGKWEAQIKIFGKVKWLGSFDSPERAHEAYCKAASALFGEFANHGK